MKRWIRKQWKNIFMALAALITINTLLLAMVAIEEGAHSHSVAQIAQEDMLKSTLSNITEASASADATRKRSIEDKLAGLNCDAHGGPSQDVAAELVYWSDIPRDANFKSHFRSSRNQYLTVEPDCGGFNNVRLVMEIGIVFAIVTGRTLVIPPARGINLLHGSNVRYTVLVPST